MLKHNRNFLNSLRTGVASSVRLLLVLAFVAISLLSVVYTYTRMVAPARVSAATSSNLNYQARLLTAAGNVVPDGYYNLEFKLYSVSSGGSALWTETYYDADGAPGGTPDNRVRVVNGYLSVNLNALNNNWGSITNWDQDMWLTMNVGGSAQTATPTYDGEMSPRVKLTAVPYAFQAKQAATLFTNQGTYTGEVDFATLTANRKYLLPDTSLATTASPGTICVYNGGASNCPAASGSAYYIQNDTVLQTQSNYNIQARDSGVNGTIGAQIRGAANGQTVDMLQIQAPNGTVLGGFASAGQLFTGSTSLISGSQLSVTASSAGTVGLVVRGAASQTADLLQVRNDSGVILAAFDKDGKLVFGPSGSQDTNLYRSNANELKTDDALVVAGLLTVQTGANVSGATINLNNNSNFATNINTGTSTGAVNIGNSAAGAVSVVSGSTVGITSGTSLTLTSTGANAININPGGGSNTGVVVKPTTNSTAAFQIQNAAGTTALLTADTSNMKLEVIGDLYAKGLNWTIRSSAADNFWDGITYGNGMFVAVAGTGTGNRVMTSPDGINWTTRSSAADNTWSSVVYGNGLFVAVAYSGTGNRVMTSPDGITWTSRTSAADNLWTSVTYGNGTFVAVAGSGSGNRVMTSPDGINWTIRTSAANNIWNSVTYGNGLFVAVAESGTGNRVMTSPDGITWTSRTSAADNTWFAVTYGNGLFVAIAQSGTGNRVMTSPDGINWTTRTNPVDNNWFAITYGNGLFVAVGSTGTGNRVMTSPDGITWTSRTSAADNTWYGIAYGNGQFVAVSATGTGNRVMTSGKSELTVAPLNNIYQGGMTVYGSSLYKSDANSTTAFQIQGASSTTPYINVNTLDGYVIINGITNVDGNMFQNPSFEAAGTGGISGWNLQTSGISFATDNTNAHSGNKVVTIVPSGGSSSVGSSRSFEVKQGHKYEVGAWIKAASGTDGNMFTATTWYDRNRAVIGSTVFTQIASPSTTYAYYSSKLTPPAGAVFMGVGFLSGNGLSTGTWYLDDAFLIDETRQESVIFQNAADSTTAFQIQNAAGTSNLFVADTSNGKIGIGLAPANNGASLQVNSGGISSQGNISSWTDISAGGNLSLAGPNGGITRFMPISSNMGAGAAVIQTAAGDIGTTTTARDYRVFGVALTGGASGSSNKIVVAGYADVSVGTGAVAIGDQLVTSTTAGEAMVDNSATTGIIGYATSSKAGGSAGTVSVNLQIHGGQYSPVFRNAADSTAALQVQNAAGANIFNVDTTNSKVGTINTTAASTNSQTLTIKSGNATGATSNSGDVVIDSGSATGTAGNISIGTGAYAHNTTIGSTTGSSALTLQAGTGALTIQNQGTGAINIGNNAVNSTINIGKTGTTANTTTVNIGTSTGAAQTVNLGSSNASSVLNMTSGAIAVTSDTNSFSVKSNTNRSEAFRVQDSAGNVQVSVDTSASQVELRNSEVWIYGVFDSPFASRSTSATGGTLAANTYYYAMVAYNRSGTVPGAASAPITTTGSTSTVTLNWSTVSNATGYRVYRSTDNVNWSYRDVGNVATFVDTGSLTFTASSTPYTDTNTTSSLWMQAGALFYLNEGASTYLYSDFNTDDLHVVASGSGVIFESDNFQVRDNYGNTHLLIDNADGATLFQNDIDSNDAFQIQNANGDSLFIVDTSAGRLAVGPNAVPANGVLTVGTNTTAASGGIYFGTDTNLYRSAASKLKTSGTLEANQFIGFPSGGAGATAFGTWISGNTDNPFQITADGILKWGSGSAAPDATLYRSGVGELTTNSDLVIQGGDLLTNQTTFNLLNTTATSINFAGAATTLNVGPGGASAATINFAGGSGATGCTIDGATGNLACSGIITASNIASSLFTRIGTTLQPATAGDNIQTSGNISTTSTGTITSAGLLTGSAGLTVTGAATSISGGIINLNNNSNFATNINTGTSTGAVNIGNSAAGAVSVVSGSTVGITSGTSLTLTSTGANAININPGGGSNTGVVVKPTTNSTAAFQIQDASGGFLFNVDSSNSNITLNGNNTGALQTWQTATGTGFSARAAYGSVVANGYIYIIGGYDGSAGSSTVQYARILANGNLGNWATTNPLPGNRTDLAAVYANGYIYAIGGATTANPANTTSTVYYAKVNSDGTVSSWNTSSNPLPAATYRLGATVLNGYLYVIGGNSGGSNVAKTYYAKLNADGTTGKWASGKDLDAVAADNSVTTANGYIFVLTGNSGIIQAAKPDANGLITAWSAAGGTTPGQRAAAQMAAMNGYLYVIGGAQNSGSTSSYASTYYANINVDGTLSNWKCQGSAGDCTGVTLVNSNALPSYRGYGGTTPLVANGYVYWVGGDDGSSLISTVSYASTSRVKINGSLDLIGDSGEYLSEGGTGGMLTAGNTKVVGSLDVQGAASFMQGVSIDRDLRVGGSVLFQNNANASTALQIQNASGVSNIQLTTINLISNSTFESGTLNVDNTVNGWFKKLGSETSIKTQNSNAQFGSNALEIVTTTTAQQGVKASAPLVSSTQYTLSFYAKVSSGSFSTLTFGRADNGGTDTACVTNGSITTTYTRFSCTFTTGSAVSSTIPPYIYITKGTDTTARTIYIDGVQLEAAASATAYREGDLRVDALATFRTSADSTTAFQIQSSTGSNVFTADTTGQTITVGNSASNGTVTINGAAGTSLLTLTPGTGTSADSGWININSGRGYFGYNGSTDRAVVRGGNSKGVSIITNDTTVAADFASNGSVTFKNGTDSTTAFQIQNAGGNALLVADTTTNNLITAASASFEAAHTWSAKGTISGNARNTNYAQIGANSLAVTTNGNANTGVRYTSYALQPNTTYNYSMYVRSDSGTLSAGTIVIGRQDDNSTDSNCSSIPTISASGWTLISCSFTTGGTITGGGNIYVKQTDAASRIFYIDGVQLTLSSLLANQGAEIAIAGNWALKGSATVTQDATQFNSGTKSLKVVATTSAPDGVRQSITLADSTAYTLSFYAKLDGASAALSTMAAGYSSDGSTDGNICTQNQTVVSTGWTQYTCTLVTPSSHSGTPFIFIKHNSTTAHTFYVDDVQLTLGRQNSSTYGEGRLYVNSVISSPLVVQNSNDSTGAFQVQKANGSLVLGVDTVNGRLLLGPQSSTGVYLWQENGGLISTNVGFRANNLTIDDVANIGGDTTITGTLDVSNNVSVGNELYVNTVKSRIQGSNSPGNNLLVRAGDGGAGASPTTGGNLLLQGGSAGGTGNANGGAVTLTGGTGIGTGTQGLINLSTSAFTSASEQSFSSSTSITAGNVNLYSSLPVKAITNTGSVLTIPDPAQGTIGRLLYISARSGSLDFTMRLNSSRTPIDIAMKANSTATLIWNGTDWTAAGASSSTDLQSAYNNTLTSAGGAEIVLNPSGGAADGFTIRNNATTPISGGILEVQSSIGTNLFSVNNFGTELAANGGAETSGTFGTNWTGAPAGGTITRTTTSGQYVTGLAGAQVVTAGTNYGVRNNLSGNPVVSTTYQVSFTAKLSSGTFTALQVLYSRDGGTNTQACANYSTQTLLTTEWTKITCTITTDATTATDPDLIIRQTDATGRTFWIDNLSFMRNDSTTTPSNVQIGGGINGGPVTLFTLDRSTAPPVADGNTTYLGSMYYDTTTGRIQCYEADGWGACGSAPDNIITLTPEYTGAVLNGSGVGTMTADFCANQTGVLQVNTGFCSSGLSRQYYKWTSPQASDQTYSIYVSYKLPSTFKAFASASTITLTALSDHATNGSVAYQMFRSTGSAISECGTSQTVTSAANTWYTIAHNGDETSGTCGFAAGDNIVFKINVTAKNNATVYVENLNFTYTNK